MLFGRKGKVSLGRNRRKWKKYGMAAELLEATARIELAIRVLQTPALPLGYVASLSDSIVPGPGLVREWQQWLRRRFYKALITRQCGHAKTELDGAPNGR